MREVRCCEVAHFHFFSTNPLHPGPVLPHLAIPRAVHIRAMHRVIPGPVLPYLAIPRAGRHDFVGNRGESARHERVSVDSLNSTMCAGRYTFVIC
jgi:hypothetical protein